MARRSRLGIVVAVTGLSVALFSYLALAQPPPEPGRIGPFNGELVDLASAPTNDPSGVSSSVQACAAQAGSWNDLKTKLLAAASQPGPSTTRAGLAKELARQVDPSAGSTGIAAFLQKVVRTLEAIDVVSTVSRAAGYTWDGERTGAHSPQTEEAIRKATVAVEGNVRKETGAGPSTAGAGGPR